VPQECQTRAQPRSNLTEGFAELLRDFRLRVSFEYRQFQSPLLGLRQLAKRSLQQLTSPIDQSDQLRSWQPQSGFIKRIGFAASQRRESPQAAQTVNRKLAGSQSEPGLGAHLPLSEPSRLVPEPQESLLEDFLGGAAVGENPHQHSE
jgi:hypothetical protein